MNKKNTFYYIMMLFVFLTSCAKNVPTQTSNEPQNTSQSGISQENNKAAIVAIPAEKGTLYINSKCIGCWKCTMIDKSHFKANFDAFRPDVISQENLDTDSLSKAMKVCPVDAIHIS